MTIKTWMPTVRQVLAAGLLLAACASAEISLGDGDFSDLSIRGWVAADYEGQRPRNWNVHLDGGGTRLAIWSAQQGDALTNGPAAGIIDLGDPSGRSDIQLEWPDGVPLPSSFSGFSEISDDGSVLIGFAGGFDTRFQPFRWRPGGPAEFFSELAELSYAQFNDLSADGGVIVGRAGARLGEFRGFRIVDDELDFFLERAGHLADSGANAISADGTRIVGYLDPSESDSSGGGGIVLSRLYDAFSWSEGEGITILEKPAGYDGAIAEDVSGDGSTISGSVWKGPILPESTAAIWRNGEVQIFEETALRRLNYDGSVAVGERGSLIERQAVRWSAEHGVESVAEWLRRSGVEVDGFNPWTAVDVSADGSIVVGSAYPNGTSVSPGGIVIASSVSTPYVARAGRGFVVLDENTFADLAAVATVPAVAGQLSGLALNGSRHRLLHHLPDEAGDDRKRFWVSGDFARDDDREADFLLGDAGRHWASPDGDWRFGFGLGFAAAEQELSLNGEATVRGPYLLAEINRCFDGGPVLGLTGVLASYDLKTTRRYLNAGSVEASRGRSDVYSLALRSRLDWTHAYRNENWTLGPRVDLSYGYTRLDGYGETGGSFPANYNDHEHQRFEVRGGFEVSRRLSDRQRLIGMLEAVHLFDDTLDGPSGDLLGVLAFQNPDVNLEQNWFRVGLEHHYVLSDRQSLRIHCFLAGDGDDPSTSAGVSYSLAF